MTIVFSVALIIIWLNVGIFAARAMNELDGSTPLEPMALPLRLIVIVFAPIGLLVFERHLFYSKAEPDNSI